MRVTVRVRPGCSRTLVGGTYAGALVVRVVDRAIDGKASAAALRALAHAFGVPDRDVRIITGARSHTKIVEINNGDPQTLADLMER